MKAKNLKGGGEKEGAFLKSLTKSDDELNHRGRQNMFLPKCLETALLKDKLHHAKYTVTINMNKCCLISLVSIKIQFYEQNRNNTFQNLES